MELQLTRLAAEVKSGFAETHRRFDAADDRLEAIETQVRITNGKVIRHDEQIRTLFERIKDGALRAGLSLAELKWYLAIAAGAAGAAWWFAHLMAGPQIAPEALTGIRTDMVNVLMRIDEATTRQEELQGRLDALQAAIGGQAPARPSSPQPAFPRDERFVAP